MSTIQWFPGHMAKANRQMEEQLKLVDIVIELRDARCPLASFNPNFDKMFANKPRLVILNKADLADDKQNQLWLKYFGLTNTLLLDSCHENIKNKVVSTVQLILKDKLEKAKARGIRNKTLRAMVVGIPNVGKSTFINNVVKKSVAKVENRPGVTKSVAWININEDLSLLDTPGVLWPRFEDQEMARKLALIGSINNDVIDTFELANYGLEYLINNYPGVLKSRYGIDESSKTLLNDIGLNKKCLGKNGEVDMTKTVNLVLNEIRSNALGRISYEKCDARE